MSDTHFQATYRQANGRYGPGSPGRRPGSRNRVSHKLVMAMLKDFETHQSEMMAALRENHLPRYFDMLARSALKMLVDEPTGVEAYTDTEVARIVARARQALATASDPRHALVELTAAISVDPSET